MNRSLIYLWVTLLKRKSLHFCKSLRRPATAIGFLAVLALIGFLFYFRREEWVGHLLERRVLVGGAMIMLCGSLFKGFLQRGLVFEPPDLEFLFTSPFTQRQIVCYRLLPNYAFAVLQSILFVLLFATHLTYPLVTGICLGLFQMVCFHVATSAAIFSGTIPEVLHQRLRWMMLGAFFFLTALYLRVAWDLRIVPGFFASPQSQVLFYPAVSLLDIANTSALQQLIFTLAGRHASSLEPAWKPFLYVACFAGGSLISAWLLLKQKGDIFEPALETTSQYAERRTRIRQGRQAVPINSTVARSQTLTLFAGFRGVGAIIWKNIIVARRSKREVIWVSAFAFIYTGFTAALLYLYHHYAKKAGVTPPPDETAGFHIGIALFLASLILFLQRMVPFDFRRDGHHIVNFRTLPFSSWGIAWAELAVPTAFCLALLAPCIIALVVSSNFSVLTTLLIALAYPAVALALNAVWNIHYLIAATKRAAGQNVSAVGTLLIVALSFLVFYPAAWATLRIGQLLPHNSGIQLPLLTGLAIQYCIDLGLVLLLARLYNRFEVAR
ncbi:MAG TPA: putative ABC exporter domain-containing protein [Candidatus Limnocylindrales bacterium]|jgi:hypothetical protein|nr:putative ABC exporter domain-containing protein [Candidatus Limnocylindrales bacterium]